MELEIDEGKLASQIVTINGYKFFRDYRDQFQCVTCLQTMVLIPREKITGQVRELFIRKDCDCPPQS